MFGLALGTPAYPDYPKPETLCALNRQRLYGFGIGGSLAEGGGGGCSDRLIIRLKPLKGLSHYTPTLTHPKTLKSSNANRSKDLNAAEHHRAPHRKRWIGELLHLRAGLSRGCGSFALGL